MTPSSRLPGLVAGCALALALSAAGCKKGDSLSDYDRAKLATDQVAQTLEDQGAKLHEAAYPPFGTAWVVDMRGMTVTDDQIRLLRKFRCVAELDLSKSTVTDDHLALIHELDMEGLFLKLDLSDTAVTDAGVSKLSCPHIKELKVDRTRVSPGVAAAVKTKK